MKNTSLDTARTKANFESLPSPEIHKPAPKEQSNEDSKKDQADPSKSSSLNKFLDHIDTPREPMPEREEYGKTEEIDEKNQPDESNLEKQKKDSSELRPLPEAAIKKGSEVLARTIDMVMDRIIAWAKREEPNGFVASASDLKNIRDSLENYAYQHPELFQFAAGNELFITLAAIYGIPVGMALWYRFENPDSPKEKKEVVVWQDNEPEYTAEQIEQLKEWKRKKEEEKEVQKNTVVENKKVQPKDYFPEKWQYLLKPINKPLPEHTNCMLPSCQKKFKTKDGFPKTSNAVPGFEKQFCSREHMVKFRNENRLFPHFQKKTNEEN
jgi:hypothetical protein